MFMQEIKVVCCCPCLSKAFREVVDVAIPGQDSASVARPGPLPAPPQHRAGGGGVLPATTGPAHK